MKSAEPQLLPAVISSALPAVFQSSPAGERRFWEFFTVNIRNPHTRRAYFNAVSAFAVWCEEKRLHHLAAVTPMHVAAYVEQLGRILRVLEQRAAIP
jgi:integrase/recombinase XerD